MRVGTTRDVMELLHCSDDYVYELAARNDATKIPTLRRIGGQLRFDLDEVEAWLRAGDEDERGAA